jgi:hypothetical protein
MDEDDTLNRTPVTRRDPLSSWETEALTSRLVLARIVASVEPNADRSGFLWEIRVARTRRHTGVIAESRQSTPSMWESQIGAEDWLRSWLADLGRQTTV